MDKWSNILRQQDFVNYPDPLIESQPPKSCLKSHKDIAAYKARMSARL